MAKIYSNDKYRIKANRNFFSFPLTKEAAYFLGYIWADGCVKSRGYTLAFCINTRDEDILQKLKDCMESDVKIKRSKVVKKSGHICDISMMEISGMKLVEDLAYYGIVPRKTYINSAPKNIEGDNVFHFIRGVIDGDGCISKMVGLAIAGVDELHKWIKDILEKNGVERLRISYYGKNNVPGFSYLCSSGIENIKKIYDLLYKDCGELYMKRKRENFEWYIKNKKCFNFEYEKDGLMRMGKFAKLIGLKTRQVEAKVYSKKIVPIKKTDKNQCLFSMEQVEEYKAKINIDGVL